MCTMKHHVHYPSTMMGGDRRTLRLTGHQPSSGFSERPCFKEMRLRELQQDTRWSPLASAYVHRCTHLHLVHTTHTQRERETETEKLVFKFLSTNVYSTDSQNDQPLRTSQVLSSRRMDFLNVVHLFSEILFSH